MMSAQPRYKAMHGKIYVKEPDGITWRETSSALTSNGRDVEKFENARITAAAQRKTSSAV
jgi:hypothetical protein